MAADKFPIVTARTILRRLTPADLEQFQRYRHDDEVGQYQDWVRQNDADALRYLKETRETEFLQPGEWFRIAIADRKTDTLIGDIGVHLSKQVPDAEIGFTLRRESQGLGLGTEAISAVVAFLFEQTDIRRITGVTDDRNIAAIKLLEKLGMRRLQTNNVLFRGSPAVEHLYALSRADASKLGSDRDYP